MIGRIIEVAEQQRHLSLKRGFMVVSHKEEELGRIGLDQIDAVIATGYGLTHSSNLLSALAERNIPFVLCASNFSPVALLWPLTSNYQQTKRIQAQLSAKKPQHKRLWQQIVKAKLKMQAAALATIGKPSAPIEALIPQVKSGDPTNREAQAARRYWKLMFGNDFRRDRDLDDHNALLNYGYTIIRSCVARGIAATGLHPSIGLHHHNTFNPMGLADDLMEPFRPIVDLRVYGMVKMDQNAVSTETKRELVALLYHDWPTERGLSPIITTVYQLCSSLAQCLMGERKQLDVPTPSSPLTMDAIVNHLNV